MAYVLQRKTRLKQLAKMNFLKLIRYQNLLLIAFMQLVFRYGFLKLQNIYLSLADWQYGLLALATVLIAAGGFIINDIMDQETDSVNKPNSVIIGKYYSEDFAYNIYIGLNIIALIIGYYLSNVIHKTSFFAVFIIPSILLYVYATSFKKVAVIGNLIVALVIGLSVIMIGFYDLIPAMYEGNQQQMMLLLYILLDYTIFAVFINFIREIVKDIEDVEGDYTHGMSTLPILIGKEKATKLVTVLAAVATLVLFWYVNKNILNSKLYYAAAYCLLLVISPMLLFTIKIASAKSKKEFHFLSSLLKVIIFFGILSILIITLNIKYNAQG
jgi:4-hydroxybenzoate polyprenyltransferase